MFGWSRSARCFARKYSASREKSFRRMIACLAEARQAPSTSSAPGDNSSPAPAASKLMADESEDADGWIEVRSTVPGESGGAEPE